MKDFDDIKKHGATIKKNYSGWLLRYLMTMFQRQGYKTSDEKGSSRWADKDLERGHNGLFDGSVYTMNWKMEGTKYKYQNRSQPSRDTKVKPRQ